MGWQDPSNFIKVQIGLTLWENKLTALGAIPILGAVPAALKMATGVVQVVSSLVAGIIFAVPAIFDDFSRNMSRHAFTHFKHGFANIGLGFVQLFPIIQTFYWALCERGASSMGPYGYGFYRECARNPYPYKDFEQWVWKDDWPLPWR